MLPSNSRWNGRAASPACYQALFVQARRSPKRQAPILRREEMSNLPDHKESVRISILLAQYEVCAEHHIDFMDLIWKVPALAVVIGGGLLTFAFSAHLPPALRAFVLLIGAAFMLVMTISLERYRMFQFRRRKDLEDIESELAAFGARALSWGGDEIVRQIRNGELSLKGLPLYRFEGFQWIRGMMYFMTLTTVALLVLAVLGAIGRGPLAGA